MRRCELKTVDGDCKTVECFTVQEFPYDRLNKIAVKSKTKKNTEYIYSPTAFDIETTTINDGTVKFSFMYHWQICIQTIPVYGRYWDEFIYFLKKLIKHLELGEKRILVIYVHNLPYEFQFMRDFLGEIGGFEGFFIDKRKPLSIRCKEAGIEFRCSYKLSNMSLEKAVQFEKGVDVLKQSGDLDYKKIRTPATILNDREFSYCMGDVISLESYIINKMKNDADNVDTVPLTSTGYVRRDCRRATEKEKGYRDFFKTLHTSDNVYRMLKDAGRGGDTHANRLLSGKIIENIRSFDVVSSYPAMMKMKKFPMSTFTPYGDVDSFSEFEHLIGRYACLFYVSFTKLHLKSHRAMPYIPESKCLNRSNTVLDNGRVLSADIVRMCITDVDYKIIAGQYTWDEMYISDMHIAEYGKLPESILQVVDEYFRMKTELKYEIEKMKKSKEKDKTVLSDLMYKYGKIKNKLNAIFGMMYTDPVREHIYLDGYEWKSDTINIAEALEKYENSRNSFLYYAWGIWTTAHARAHLHRLVDATGQDYTIYCDTDSSYAIDRESTRRSVEIENQKIIQECEKSGAYCDYMGKRYYMGVYEDDGHIEKFKTLGAKKYVYEKGGELHVTISGVNKRTGATELGCMENFVPGFIFTKSAGLEMTYIDMPAHEITVNGCTFKTASCIASEQSTYEIGITGEYAEIIGYNYYDELEKMRIF